MFQIMKKLSFFAVLFAVPSALFLLSSCGKNALNNLSNEESRIYITNRDSTANFKSYKTFSIVDSVAVIQNNQMAGMELTSGDAQLLQLITAQMAQRGYVLVNKDQNPDLGINVTYIANTYTNVVQYPYDWWNTPGYFDPGYWGYGGYGYYFPPTFGIYQTNENYMTVDLIDLKNASQDQKLNAVWNATLKGEQVLNPGNYPSEVKAIFDQSPYLQSGK
ncbi:MAG: DUF4136 domain-containing protein [Chitinophagaceae bacterium]|nr:MAG: DUF4136 domain-containing protein [Chitinophagaceae bacterium]